MIIISSIILIIFIAGFYLVINNRASNSKIIARYAYTLNSFIVGIIGLILGMLLSVITQKYLQISPIAWASLLMTFGSTLGIMVYSYFQRYDIEKASNTESKRPDQMEKEIIELLKNEHKELDNKTIHLISQIILMKREHQPEKEDMINLFSDKLGENTTKQIIEIVTEKSK